MKTLTCAVALAATVSLGGCLQMAQPQLGSAPNSPMALSYATSQNLLYGKGTPVNVSRAMASSSSTHIARGISAGAQAPASGTSDTMQSDADNTIVYSDEWWQREKNTELRLKRSTSICRC